MKFHVPDKHLTVSNILMFLTLFAVTGGAIGVVLQQVLMVVITVACLAALALGVYAIWQVVQHSGGLMVSHDDPQQPRRIEYVHHHYHEIVERPQPQPQRMIEVKPAKYTVIAQPQQRVALPQHKQIEVKS